MSHAKELFAGCNLTPERGTQELGNALFVNSFSRFSDRADEKKLKMLTVLRERVRSVVWGWRIVRTSTDESSFFQFCTELSSCSLSVLQMSLIA